MMAKLRQASLLNETGHSCMVLKEVTTFHQEVADVCGFELNSSECFY